MKLKSVKKIRDEYWDNNQKLSKESLEMLKKYLEGNDPDELALAIDLATDLELYSFAPLIAKHLTDESSFVREIAIGQLLGILKLPEYAEIGLKMAQEDESSGVRCLATKGLGHVLDKTDNEVKKVILSYMYDVMTKDIYDADTKQDVYRAMTIALNIPWEKRPSLVENPDLRKIVKPEIVQKFKEKYGLFGNRCN